MKEFQYPLTLTNQNRNYKRGPQRKCILSVAFLGSVSSGVVVNGDMDQVFYHYICLVVWCNLHNRCIEN